MTPKRTAALLIVLFYLGAGGLCLSEPVPRPWGQPTPDAKWIAPIPRDDPRPFLIRLLTSIRWDWLHKDIRGGAEF
jgi:hypothetical protein